MQHNLLDILSFLILCNEESNLCIINPCEDHCT